MYPTSDSHVLGVVLFVHKAERAPLGIPLRAAIEINVVDDGGLLDVKAETEQRAVVELDVHDLSRPVRESGTE